MKIVVLAGGLSPERNVSLSSGTKIAEALQSKGHQVALVDMYFGEEDYPGLTGEALYGVPLPEKWRSVDRQAPDLEEVRKVRKWSGKGDFGPGVLELCKGADVVFLALHGQCGEDGRVQRFLEKPGWADFLAQLGRSAGVEITDLDSLERALEQLRSWGADCTGLGAQAAMGHPARWHEARGIGRGDGGA